MRSSAPTLPPLQDRWMRELLGETIPGEARSTCGNCAMLEGPAPDPGPHYRADVKCCMFVPSLPNFIVGGILLDTENPAGIRSLRARLSRPDCVMSPRGLSISKAEAEAQSIARSQGEFGLRTDLRCPHWAGDGGGTCTIWRNREAICSTWWCRHSRGATSGQLWSTLRRLLQVIEEQLSRWAIEQVDPARKDGSWGDWEGRPEDFYRACAAAVSTLSWKEVRRIGGAELGLHSRMVRDAWAELNRRRVPQRLRPGPRETAPLGEDRERVWGWSPTDALDLPTALLARLPAFAGREAAAVMAELMAEGALDEAILLRLADWRLLVMEDGLD